MRDFQLGTSLAADAPFIALWVIEDLVILAKVTHCLGSLVMAKEVASSRVITVG